MPHAMNEGEVWRTPARLVRNHGGAARANAGHFADLLKLNGFAQCSADWKRIRSAVEELQRRCGRHDWVH